MAVELCAGFAAIMQIDVTTFRGAVAGAKELTAEDAVVPFPHTLSAPVRFTSCCTPKRLAKSRKCIAWSISFKFFKETNRWLIPKCYR